MNETMGGVKEKWNQSIGDIKANVEKAKRVVSSQITHGDYGFHINSASKRPRLFLLDATTNEVYAFNITEVSERSQEKIIRGAIGCLNVDVNKTKEYVVAGHLDL